MTAGHRFLIGTLAVPPLAFLRGWAIATLWLWFVVPIGVPALTIWHAAGVSLIIGLLTHQVQHEPDDTANDLFWTRFLTAIIGPPICVGWGWLIHWAMNL